MKIGYGTYGLGTLIFTHCKRCPDGKWLKDFLNLKYPIISLEAMWPEGSIKAHFLKSPNFEPHNL